MDYNSIQYFECDCGSEIIRLESTVELKGKEHYRQEFSFAIFEYKPSPYSLSDRIRIAFRILFKGEQYGDQIILNTDAALRLSKFIKNEYEGIEDTVFSLQNLE